MTDKANHRDQGNNTKEAGQQRQQRKHWQKKRHHRLDGKKKDKDPEEIPILKYGPSNNVFKFKEALSKTALRDYGHLGTLIKTGQYYKPPEPDIADYDLVNDIYGINRATFMEDLKESRKETLKMHADRPKLYALIMQYLSEESLDEIKRSDQFEDIEKKTDPLDLWKQTIRQGPYESIISFKERFNSALKAYEDQDNPKMDDKDVAMDFFRSLDNARYGDFKIDTMNNMTSKAMEPPENLNAMYLLANQWLKPNTKPYPTGFATTFATTLDMPEKPKGEKRGKKKGGKREENKSENKDKDLSHIDCFACGENGHYANACPTRQNKAKEDNEDKHSHVTWHASTFTTYQVLNVSDTSAFGKYDVLLDNQANVSIVHSDLLRDIQDADEVVKINGVGGHQFSVSRTGYLDPLFRVYASDDTVAVQ